MPRKTNKEVLEAQKGRYTPEQMIQLGDALHARISETCDGYLFIGFVAGAANEPIHLNVYNDSRTGLALRKFLEDVVLPGSCSCDDDGDGADDWRKSKKV